MCLFYKYTLGRGSVGKVPFKLDNKTPHVWVETLCRAKMLQKHPCYAAYSCNCEVYICEPTWLAGCSLRLRTDKPVLICFNLIRRCGIFFFSEVSLCLKGGSSVASVRTLCAHVQNKHTHLHRVGIYHLAVLAPPFISCQNCWQQFPMQTPKHRFNALTSNRTDVFNSKWQ